MKACTHCSYPLEDGATFCVNCGTRLSAVAHPQATPAWSAPQGPAASPQRHQAATAAGSGSPAVTPPAARGFVPSHAGIAVCTGCGVIAPTARDFCAICDTRFSPTRPNAPLSRDHSFWVAIEARFECRSCGQSAPLNHLDVDGAVKCMHCGVEQRFDAERWTPLLSQAHALGDLAGPNPEGRFPRPGASVAGPNPYKSIGHSDTLVSQERPPLRVRIAPGHPLCSRCKSPLAVRSRTHERLTTECPGCSETRSYDLPAQGRGRFFGLVGVLGDEHEHGSRDVRTELDAGGAVIIRCPNCTAPLTPTSEHSILHCQYCSAACRITPEAMWRAGIKSLRADWWWLLFQGPSQERQHLETQIRGRPLPPQWNAASRQIQAGAQQAVATGARALLVSMSAFIVLGIAISVFVFSAATGSDSSGTSITKVVSKINQPTWSGTGRAVLSDVNGDGVMDVLGRARQLQPTDVMYVAAFNGADGQELWRSSELGRSGELTTTPLATQGSTLVIASDQAQLFAIGTKDGKSLWQGRLGEKVDTFCAGDAADHIVVVTRDKQRQRLELSSGTLAALPLSDPKQAPECANVVTDQQRAAPPGTVLYQWSNEYREMVLRDRAPGIDADAALHASAAGVTIALGHKNPGSRIPMIAAYRWEIQDDESKLTSRQKLLRRHRPGPVPKGEPQVLWTAIVPGIDPLTVREDEPEPHYVHLNDNTVVVAYETKDTHKFRLTAFELQSGARRWDVELPGDRPMGGVLASASHAFVSRWSGLAAFDIRTGKQVW